MGRFVVAVSLAHLYLFSAYVKLGAVQPWASVDSIFAGGFYWLVLMLSAILAPFLLGYLGLTVYSYLPSIKGIKESLLILVGIGGLLSLVNGLLIADLNIEQTIHIPILIFIGQNLKLLVLFLGSLTIMAFVYLVKVSKTREKVLVLGSRLFYILSPLTLFSVVGIFYLMVFVSPLEATPQLDRSEWGINGPGHVVILLFDALSYTSVFGTENQVYPELPNIKAIVDQSTVFHNVPSYKGGTVRNIPIILTGRVYPEGGIKLNDQEEEIAYGLDGSARVLSKQKNIFDIAYEKGYLLTVFGYSIRYCSTYVQEKGYCRSTSPNESNTQPESFNEAFFEIYRLGIVKLLPTRLEYGIQDLLGIQSLTSTGKRVLDLQDEVLYRLSGPGFIYAHYPIPHVPYISLDPSTREIKGSSNPLDSIQAVDFFLGEIKSRMIELDQWNRTLLVIMADHQDGYITQDTRTPFIIKIPGQTERIDVYEEWSHKNFLNLLEEEITK